MVNGLKKIENELQSRDFSEIKTDRLLDLGVKLIGEIRSYENRDHEIAHDNNVVTVDELEQIARMDFKVAN